MPEDDFIKIRKRDLIRLVFFVLLISAGYLLNDVIKGPSAKISTNINTCKQFCSLVSLEYAFVKDNNCYCNQKQVIYNQARNETFTIFQTINVGIVKNMTVEAGLTQEALDLMKRQQAQNQR